MLSCLIPLLAIIIFAFAIYVIFKFNPSTTPIISLTGLISVVIIFSLIGMLKQGVIVAYAISIASFIYASYKSKNNLKTEISNFLTAGNILFIFSSVAMLVFLSYRKPLITEWDEYSFWATSQKLTKINDAIYTYYNSSLVGKTTPPTLAVLSYFFNFIGDTFYEWKSFFAYDVMFFACFSAFTAKFDKKQAKNSIIVFVFGFITPYIFEVYTKIIHLEPMYMFTLADIPLGILFASALAVYFFNDDCDTKQIVSVIPMLFFYTLVKDMGFAFSCIVIFIIFFDLLVSKKDYKFIVFKKLIGKIIASITLFAVAVSGFLAWAIHMANVMEVDRFNLGGETNMGMVQMLITGVTELLSSQKSEKFITIQQYMISALFNRPIWILGNGITIIALIFVIFAVCITVGNNKDRIRFTVLYITSLIGFVGYYVFHIFLYVYIFKDNAYGLVSYERYIYAYYMGWLLLAILVTSMTIMNNKKPRLFIQLCLLSLTVALFALLQLYTNDENIFIQVNDQIYSKRMDIQAKVDSLQDVVGEDDVIYCYAGEEDGEKWFMYTFLYAEHFLPREIPYLDKADMTDEEYNSAKVKQTTEYFKEMGVTHFLVDFSGYYTYDYLAECFDEPVGDIGVKSCAYYEVDYVEDSIKFNLVKKGLLE